MLWSGFDHRFILFKTSAVKKTLCTEPGCFFKKIFSSIHLGLKCSHCIYMNTRNAHTHVFVYNMYVCACVQALAHVHRHVHLIFFINGINSAKFPKRLHLQIF